MTRKKTETEAAPAALPSSLEELASLVASNAEATQAQLDEMRAQLQALDEKLSKRAPGKAGGDVAELAAKLHDFGVRLGLVAKGDAPSAAEQGPKKKLVFNGVGFVPGDEDEEQEAPATGDDA